MVKAVNLVKIPEVKRAPGLDYTDDGSRFRGYIYKDLLPITYTSFKGMIFVDIRLDPILDWDDYKNETQIRLVAKRFNGEDREKWDPILFQQNLEFVYDYVVDVLTRRKTLDRTIERMRNRI